MCTCMYKHTSMHVCPCVRDYDDDDDYDEDDHEYLLRT